MKPPFPSLFVATCILAGGCAGTPTPSPDHGVDLSGEASVRPGINDSYVDADVAEWMTRFETESREVYQRREEIVAACEIQPGSELADIGAGTGFFAVLFGREVGPSGHIFAVDITSEFLVSLEERVQGAGLDNVSSVLCTERSVELPPSSVDVAFTCNTYHHFEYPRNSLRSIYEALRPGGQFIVVELDRVPGESSEFIMNHVRAGKDVFVAEIEAAGFELIEDRDFLDENFFARFRRPR